MWITTFIAITIKRKTNYYRTNHVGEPEDHGRSQHYILSVTLACFLKLMNYYVKCLSFDCICFRSAYILANYRQQFFYLLSSMSIFRVCVVAL